MRVPSVYSRDATRGDAAMTPMIDVVFLLLIFFVWTASFQVVEVLLPSELTSSAEAGPEANLQEEDFERIVVRILVDAIPGSPRWSINGRPLGDWSEVQATLAELAGIRADLPVVIDPEFEVPLGDVIDVYDAARNVGLGNIQFTARTSG